mmetsp:Transcript_28493/g.77154  ORF Transcript_28493/g.77154 Transcript_28493/m.77154 type:complete len:86 (+) Transcript_28493:1494-1751(+)
MTSLRTVSSLPLTNNVCLTKTRNGSNRSVHAYFIQRIHFGESAQKIVTQKAPFQAMVIDFIISLHHHCMLLGNQINIFRRTNFEP